MATTLSMKQLLLFLSLFTVLAFTLPEAQAAVLHPVKQTEAVDKAERQMSKKEMRQERRAQRKSFRKALRQQIRDMRKRGKADDVELILLVIIALFIPPLAMYLYDGDTTSRFWISLILMLAAIPLWGILGALALTASVLYTLYIILSESL